MKKILVAGGAGYIGSHMVALLKRSGIYEPIVADSLITGHAASVKNSTLMVGDLRDKKFLGEIFSTHKIDGVIDFAAFSLVEESYSDPLKYYANNLVGAIEMLNAMREYGVKKIVFSSTAAAYGEAENQPVDESAPSNPTNPYGDTKLAIEKMLKWCDNAYGIKYAALRYFNAAGADNDTDIGEAHDPESHLIPRVLKAAQGISDYIGINGADYPTPDGTCIRDYIHVMDLVEAHLLAYEYLDKNPSDVFNLGNGNGFSVKNIIDTAEKVVGREIPKRIVPRRPGDPAMLVASNKKAIEVLGWQPKRADIGEIIASAWKWHTGHPYGYDK